MLLSPLRATLPWKDLSYLYSFNIINKKVKESSRYEENRMKRGRSRKKENTRISVNRALEKRNI